LVWRSLFSEYSVTARTISPEAAKAVAGVVVGITLISWGFRWLLLELRKRRWPAATGCVIDYRVGNAVGDATEWYADPIYRFEAGNDEVTGDRRSLGPRVTEPHRGRVLEEVQRQYPVGAAVTVYYDPKNPANSALDRRPSVLGPLVLLVGGSMFLAASLLS
jgi:hypothetical protein